jgi:hypothetical protein
MTDQNAVGAHQHGRFPASLDRRTSCGEISRASKWGEAAFPGIADGYVRKTTGSTTSACSA